MKNEQKVRKIFHAVLRLSFGFCLFLLQFTSNCNDRIHRCLCFQLDYDLYFSLGFGLLI